MSREQITKEQARVGLENYLTQKAKDKAGELEIEDEAPKGSVFYKNFSSQDCFYVSLGSPGHVGLIGLLLQKN